MVCHLGPLPTVSFLKALTSFHQWGWTLALFISARTHQLVYQVWYHFEPWPRLSSREFGWDLRLGSSHACRMVLGAFAGRQLWGFQGQGSRGAGSVILLFGLTPTRKVVRSGGSVRLLPNSSSTSNLTCFFICCLYGNSSIGSCRGGHSSVGVGVSSHYTLLWDLHGLRCRLRSSREQLHHLLAGHVWGGWERMTGASLGTGMRVWCHLNLSLPLEWEHCLLDPDYTVEGSSLGCLTDSAPLLWV